MDNLVSIIIPVYNVKKFLEDCVQSIIEQTYSNIEILLVDDGSTDGSQTLCDDLKKTDERITVIHKKNGGLSDARNVGISSCKGEFIYFLDSDDFIQKDAIDVLVKLCNKKNVDIAITEYETFTEKNPASNNGKHGKSVTMNAKDAIKMMLLPGNYDHCSCGKLFKKSLWTDITFPYRTLYEDLSTSYDVFLKADKVAFYTLPKYCYRIRKGSIMNSSIMEADLILLDISDRVTEMLIKVFPDLEEIVVNKQTTTYVNLMRHIMITDPKKFLDTQERIISLCRKNLKRSLYSKYMRTNDKIKVLTVCTNKKLFNYAYNMGIMSNRIFKKKNIY